MAKKQPILFALDPGNKESAYVRVKVPLDDSPPFLLSSGKILNGDMLDLLRGKKIEAFDEADDPSKEWGPFDIAIAEYPFPRGQFASSELFDTLFFIGQFFTRIQDNHPGALFDLKDGGWKISREKVKLAVCGRRASVSDSNIRHALMDIYGGEDKAVGGTKCRTCKGKGWRGREREECPACKGAKWLHPPGPLHGLTADRWAALGVAYTWCRAQHEEKFSAGL